VTRARERKRVVDPTLTPLGQLTSSILLTQEEGEKVTGDEVAHD
jgi:hypothetical protein